jgi:hypothetical protein
MFGFPLDCTGNKLFFNAVVTLLRLLFDSLHHNQPSKMALNYFGRALAEVKKRIKNPDPERDDMILLGVGLMAVQQRVYGDRESHDLHWRYLARLIEARGGLQSLEEGSFVKRLLMIFDSTWTIATGVSIFPGQRTRPTPIYPSEYQQNLPSGFRELVREQKLSLDLLAVLSRAYDLEQNTKERKRVQAEVTRKYDDFLEACPFLGDDTSLEKLIATAMMAYSVTSTSKVPTSVFNGPRIALTNSLRNYEEKSWAERRCLLWVYVIAIDSWRDQPLQEKLVNEVWSRFPETVRQWPCVEQVVSSFFWTKEFSEYWRGHWERKVLDLSST